MINKDIWNKKEHGVFFSNYLNKYLYILFGSLTIMTSSVLYLTSENNNIYDDLVTPAVELINSPAKYYEANKNEAFSINDSSAKIKFISNKEIEITYNKKDLPIVAFYDHRTDSTELPYIPLPKVLLSDSKIDKLTVNGTSISEMKAKHMTYNDIIKNYFNTEQVVVKVFLK